MENDVVLTTQQVAALLNVQDSRVRQLARSGDLPAAHFGRDWLFRRADVDAYLASRPPRGRPRKSRPAEPTA